MEDPRDLFKIKRESKLPLYNQIEQNFWELISDGKLSPGDAVPSEWELSELYGVSRLTVRRALDDLAHHNWLDRRQGVGTFITNPSVASISPSKLSFTEQMRSIGRQPSSRLVSIQVMPASAEVANQLMLQEEDPVVEIKRVRLAAGKPILFEASYLSQARFRELENATDLATGSLYEHLSRHYQVTIVEMVQTLQPVLLAESEALYLEAQAGSPAIYCEVVAYSNEGDPVEYCWSVTSADKSKFYFRFRRGENS
jgi:GntR family transcriptional regulator